MTSNSARPEILAFVIDALGPEKATIDRVLATCYLVDRYALATLGHTLSDDQLVIDRALPLGTKKHTLCGYGGLHTLATLNALVINNHPVKHTSKFHGKLVYTQLYDHLTCAIDKDNTIRLTCSADYTNNHHDRISVADTTIINKVINTLKSVSTQSLIDTITMSFPEITHKLPCHEYDGIHFINERVVFDYPITKAAHLTVEELFTVDPGLTDAAEYFWHEKAGWDAFFNRK